MIEKPGVLNMKSNPPFSKNFLVAFAGDKKLQLLLQPLHHFIFPAGESSCYNLFPCFIN
jgi:hypothetical protein